MLLWLHLLLPVLCLASDTSSASGDSGLAPLWVALFIVGFLVMVILIACVPTWLARIHPTPKKIILA